MTRRALLGPDGQLADRDGALVLFEYGPAWDRAGAIDDVRLATDVAQVGDAELLDTAQWRRSMFGHFVRNRMGRDNLTLRLVLELDTEEAARPAGLGHAFALALAERGSLARPQVDQLAAHDIGPDRKAFETMLLRTALVAERHQSAPERPRAMAIRRATASGKPASAILREFAVDSPLEAMLELSSAWCAKLADLRGASALVGADSAESDAALGAVATAHAEDWQLALHIGEALDRDQLDEDTLRLAQKRGVRTLIFLMHQAELSLGAAKRVAGRVQQMGSGALAPGVLSKVIAEERAFEEELLARWREDSREG